jgi:hypothetical protein
MTSLARTGAIPLPTKPYPGLRPFLDYEAPLLLGRTGQVREVIKRLEETHFVAVVGGSGSGKSSLIHAGVVPRLRGYGIPDAGSYWIPVVCTPGTTPHAASDSSGSPDRPGDRDQTPITRLAWKFAQVLAPSATSQEDADRRSEIAAAFRQGAGFTRLVEAYHDELPERGPDRNEARFLFVIDQFEELFHPNNHESDDARLIVEAVIDHFFNPHERCFVVMTMRSEHLADCAAYLELPDAINKSLYLVRRLNDQELRDAIVGPTQYYLRLLQRGREDQSAALPEDIEFDERVIERMLADVARIVGDTDHLPLLQHLLARTWEAACRREAVADGGVPRRLGWADLEKAVHPGGDTGWLRHSDGVNTLRASLENWAESTYRQHPKGERTQIEAVLRKLAFKDPNNGLYFQQRIDVDDPFLLPDVQKPRDVLKKLLAPGFLGGVNYMFWDDEDPDRVTLKVSHEAFIRGWERFRKLTDLEADRFDEFVAVLRRCALWKADRSPKLLLEASELARVEHARLDNVFQSGEQRSAWFRVLLQYRDGERLAKIEPDVAQFLAASRARVEAIEREQREAAERERSAKEAARAAKERAREAFLLLAAAATLAVVFLAVAAFGLFIQGPAMRRIADFTDARAKAERRPDTSKTGGSLMLLQDLVAAADKVESAKQGRPIGPWSADRVLDRLDFLPPVASIKQLLADTSSEPAVNGTLRNLLTTMVWPSVRDPNAVNTAPQLRGVDEEVECSGQGLGTRRGRLLLPPGVERGVFVPKPEIRENELKLYNATRRSRTCTAENIVWSVPSYLDPVILFDAQLTHLAVALNDRAQGRDYVNLYRLVWGRDRRTADATGGEPRVARLQMLSVVPNPPKGPGAAQLVRLEVSRDRTAKEQVKMVTTWPADAGLEVSINDEAYRLISDTAVPAAFSVEERGDWSRLDPPVPGSRCERLKTDLEAADRQPHLLLQQDDACFDIQRGVSGPTAGTDDDAAELGGVLLVTVYSERRLRPNNPFPPTPIANLVFSSTQTDDTGRWLVGKANGKHEYWIALEQQRDELLAAPWGTPALRRLGDEVLQAASVKGLP